MKMKTATSLLPLLCLLLLYPSCRNGQEEKPLFTLETNTGIQFRNTISNTPDFNIFSYRNFYNGGGVAIGDLDNDGLADIFFTANMGANKLYRNKGNWQFEDVTAKAGFSEKADWSTGVVLVDINHDGWLDIFVCNAGYIDGVKPKCQLYINNHDLSFSEKAEEYGLTNEGGYTTHAAFFDYDLDGDLDCFIINNSFIPVNTLNYANKRALRAPDWPVADFLKGGGDHLYRNDNGKFTDVSREAGIFGSLISFGLGVTVGDVNGDSYPDIYVSNDFFERDYLYINQKDGTFADELETRTQHISHSSMGADMADINNDGYPEIFTTDMLPDDDYRLKTTTSFDNIDVHRLKQRSGFYNQYTQNTLQVNNRDGKFMETAFYSGVSASDWSWGGLIFDADNDGLSDIFVCNGIYNDVTNQDFIDFFANDVIQQMVLSGKKEQFEEIVNKMPSQPIPNKFYRNLGSLRFEDAGEKSGLAQPSFSNGSAYGDLDNDGDLDLVINNVNQEAFIYRNQSREQEGNNYIGFSLRGKDRNRFAIGSKVTVYQEGRVISRELIPTRGFQSSVDYKIIIGLGKGIADSVRITWPQHGTQLILSPAINTVHSIGQDAEATMPPAIPGPLKWLTELPAVMPFVKHQEDDFIDFYNERNVPVMLSREGPDADTADVNGDGLVDLYIAGAAGQAGQLYLQTAQGWVKTSQPGMDAEKAFEETALSFFDADGDGDPDLVLAPGGNNVKQGSPQLQLRLFLNDGRGNFEKSQQAFPAYGLNASVVLPLDADADGDLDLFAGSRSVPMDYGIIPESFLYLNDGSGKFTVAASISPGMVTDAIVADLTGDGQAELVVVGEWMAPAIYTVKAGKLDELLTSLSEKKGWWQTVAATDINADGKLDLVLGNTGENGYLRPSKERPARLWISDFDQNGTKDKIITQSINGRDMPVFLKRELTEQLPSLKKQNLRFSEYAEKSIQQLFPGSSISAASAYEFNDGASCYALNKGDMQFEVIKFPTEVQLSSVHAILCTDIDGDGKTDLLMGGNQFHFQPQFARLDASYGHLLLNRNGAFEWIAPAQSGLCIRGEIRKILAVKMAAKPVFFFLQNNESPLMYEVNTTKK